MTVALLANGILLNAAISIPKPLSLQYIACPNAVVTMGFTVAPDLQYKWYNAASGGAIVANGDNVNTLTITKGSAADIGTWWVEPVLNGVSLSRYQVILETGNNCGTTNPTDCVDGTIIYKEDFGGNEVSDPAIKPTGIPQVIGYTYSPDLLGQNLYTISKVNPNPPNGTSWYDVGDHTSMGDDTRGYLIGFNAAIEAGQFYQYEINGLCSGSKLYFSAWIMSLIKVLKPDKANLIFILENSSGDILAQYYTGRIPDYDSNWKNYGFDFTIPNGETSVVLRIINNSTGTDGNDFVMDDIEIRLCAPPVNLNIIDSIACSGNEIELKGDYTDDGTFGENLTYRWEFTHTDNINWETLLQNDTAIISGNPLKTVWKLNSATAAVAGYYRLLVSSQGNINSVNCRMIKMGHISMNPLPELITENAEICSGHVVNLIATGSGAVSFTYYSDAAYSDIIGSGNSFQTGVLSNNTVFYIEAMSDKDCKTRDSVEITIEVPPAVITMDDAYLCYGDEITLNVLQSDGVVSWDVESLTVSPVSTQQYIVTANRPPCPDARDSVTITVGNSLYILPSALPVYKANADYSQQLTTNAESPVFTLIGNLPSGLFLSTQGGLSGQSVSGEYFVFTVQVEDIHGCKTEKEYILEKDLFIPKVFTPNGDGVNDIFMRGYKVVIFDRLGIEIFRGDDGWDGTYKGTPAPHDIYFYKLFAKDEKETEKIITGFVGLE